MTDKNSVYRERFALTLDHKPVDRCPIDLGGTPQSTVESDETIASLAEHLGLPGARPADYDKFDRRILEHWDIDFRRAGGLVPFHTGREVALSDSESVDSYGIRRRFSGQHWDIVGGSLWGASTDDVARYEFPTPEQVVPGFFDDIERRARSLYENTPYVVVGEHPVFGVLELACWLCGYEHIMMMLAADPEFIHLLFGKILQFQKSIIGPYYERIGRYIHLTTSGDDFGTQRGMFMSAQMWREFVMPYMKERIDYTAKFTDAVYMHHSCGSIFDIIGDLVAAGVRILNPIQPAASGMDPIRLKNSFGDMLTFHGGLDTQEVLPAGDPSKIEAAVQYLLAAMHPNLDGGYIFAPAHNIQSDVTPASVATMYDAVSMLAGRSSSCETQ